MRVWQLTAGGRGRDFTKLLERYELHKLATRTTNSADNDDLL